MIGARSLRSDASAALIAATGTVFIAGAAFWLSFTALADLARRSGVSPDQAWAWPLIVDGLIVVSTVAVVALARRKAAGYPWALLSAGAAVSVTANVSHALVSHVEVPIALAACVASVPPLVLLASTHLTVVLMRPPRDDPGPADAFATVAPSTRLNRRELAARLREEGWSNKAIARSLGVAPSTVGRWMPPQAPNAEPGPHEQPTENKEPTT